MKGKFVEYKDINVQGPGELAFENHKFIPVDYVLVEGVEDSQHAIPGQVSLVFTRKERSTSLRAL